MRLVPERVVLDTFITGHWRSRFVATIGEGKAVALKQVVSLMQRFNEAGLYVIKTENRYNFDGMKGYSA
jgi:hypothetical protein